MTQQVKQELKSNGFTVIQTSYWIIGILVIVVGLGVNFGMSMKRLDNLETKVTTLEVWKSSHIDEVNLVRLDLEKRLARMEEKLDLLLKK